MGRALVAILLVAWACACVAQPADLCSTQEQNLGAPPDGLKLKDNHKWNPNKRGGPVSSSSGSTSGSTSCPPPPPPPGTTTGTPPTPPPPPPPSSPPPPPPPATTSGATTTANTTTTGTKTGTTAATQTGTSAPGGTTSTTAGSSSPPPSSSSSSSAPSSSSSTSSPAGGSTSSTTAAAPQGTSTATDTTATGSGSGATASPTAGETPTANQIVDNSKGNGDNSNAAPSAIPYIGAAIGAVLVLFIIIALLVARNHRKNRQEPTAVVAAVQAPEETTVRLDLGKKNMKARVESLLKQPTTKMIGSGGAADVFKAQAEDGSWLAVKKLRESTEPRAKEEFHTEVNTLTRLLGQSHPNVVEIKFFCQDPPVIALELCSGGSVKEIMAKGLLPIAQTRDYLLQTVRGFEFLHAHGIAHMDLKPQNLLLDAAGVVKITDFGTACTANDQQSVRNGVISLMSEVTEFNGTPQYAGPERFQLGRKIDLMKADVYSFGAMAWSMVVGETPHANLSMEQFLKATPQALIEAIPKTIDVALAGVIASCLNADPAARPSFSDIRQRLDSDRTIQVSLYGSTMNSAYQPSLVPDRSSSSMSAISPFPSQMESSTMV